MFSKLSRSSTNRTTLLGALGALIVAGCTAEYDRGPTANLTTAKTYREALIATDAAEGEPGEAASTGTGWATIRGKLCIIIKL